MWNTFLASRLISNEIFQSLKWKNITHQIKKITLLIRRLKKALNNFYKPFFSCLQAIIVFKNPLSTQILPVRLIKNLPKQFL